MTRDRLDDTMEARVRQTHPSEHVPLSGDRTVLGGEAGPRPREQEIQQGASFGRYVVLGRLGAGGMGVVYAAYDPELDRKVALKLLHPQPGEDAGPTTGRARLVREAQAMARLSHPNVVAVHDVGALAGQVWLAMEYIDGRTFTAWLKEEGRRWPEVLRVMLAAGHGLAAAHAAGLVHRDFKPDNMMIDRGGRVRVMDFGLARTSESAPVDVPAAVLRSAGGRASFEVKVTQQGAVTGTPMYMAPEQWRGEQADARADQFSFCVTLWEALFGARPYTGSSLVELAGAVLSGDRQAPSRSEVPAWLRHAVERGLAVEPERRYPSMEALLAALERGLARGKRSRVALGLAGVGLVALLVPGLFALDRARREAACEAAAVEITAAWGEDRRAALEAAVLGTGASYAASTLTKATGWIDRWARRWSEVRVDACRAGEVEGSRAPALYARARACLEERREELAALVAAITEDPRTSLPRAVRAAASLSSPDACVDWGALERRPPPPDDEATREALALHQREHARVRGLQSAGRFADALAGAEDLRARVQGAGLERLAPAVSLTLGEAAKAAGSHERAIEAFRAAYVDAGALGEDAVASEAAINLVATIGYEQSRAELGLQWAPPAEMLLRRLGQLEELPGAMYFNAQATVMRQQERFDEAEALYDRAIAIYEKKLGPDHPTLAGALNNLANLLELRGDRGRVLGLFERGLGILESSLGPDHPHVALLLANQSSALYHRHRIEEALAAAERSLAIREASLGPDHPEVGSTLLNIALLHLDRRRYGLARSIFERALGVQTRALGPEHPRVADALVGLASARRALGELDAAMEHDRRALEIYEKAWGPEHTDVAYALEGLGSNFLMRGEYARARELLERSLAIREKVLTADNAEFLTALCDLGIALERLGDRGGAQERFLRVLDLTAATPSRHAAPMAVALANLGLVEVAEGDLDTARARFERGLARLREVYGPGNVTELACVLGLGEVALVDGRPLDALTRFEEAVASAPREQTPPTDYADARFALARGLRAAKREPERARQLAREAAEVYRALRSDHPRAQEIDAWLKQPAP